MNLENPDPSTIQPMLNNRRINVPRALWAYRWLTFTGICIGLCCGYIIYLVYPTTYTSSASIRTIVDPLKGNNSIDSQLLALKNSMLIDAALADPKVIQSKQIAGLSKNQARNWILERLAITETSQDSLQISFTSYDADLSKQIVDGVVETFRAFTARTTLVPGELAIIRAEQQLKEDLTALNSGLRKNADVLTEANKLSTLDGKALDDLMVNQRRIEEISARLTLSAGLLDTVLREFDSKRTELARIEVISPASAGEPASLGLLLSLFYSGVATTLLFGCIAVLLDFAEMTFRNPREIVEEIGVPVLGHIPVIPLKSAIPRSKDRSLDISLCTLHHSRGRVSEAYRTVRTALYFSNRSGECKVIQITSPIPGDGKSTLASNLAITMAQSGKNVLLIDADFRRSKISKLFGIEPTVGLATAIAGECEIEDAICAGPIPQLSILPTPQRTRNPAELLSSQEFAEILNTLRDMYDIVILDTPPLLAVSDSIAVATLVDGVVMTLRLGRNVKMHARRAAQMLTSVNAPLIGIVVNGVSDDTGYGYNFGSNPYGYSYSYRYGDAARSGFNYPRTTKAYYDVPEDEGLNDDQQDYAFAGSKYRERAVNEDDVPNPTEPDLVYSRQTEVNREKAIPLPEVASDFEPTLWIEGESNDPELTLGMDYQLNIKILNKRFTETSRVANRASVKDTQWVLSSPAFEFKAHEATVAVRSSKLSAKLMHSATFDLEISPSGDSKVQSLTIRPIAKDAPSISVLVFTLRPLRGGNSRRELIREFDVNLRVR